MVNAATKASGFFAKGLVVGQGNGLDRHQIWHCRAIVNVLTCSEVVAFDGARRSQASLRVKQHGSRSSRLWLKQETSRRQAGDKQETSRRQAGDKQETSRRQAGACRAMAAVDSELAQCTNSMQERDPARRPEASVTMWSSANASSQRRKPQEVLSAPAGRVFLRAGDHGRGTLLQRDKARRGATTGAHAFIGRCQALAIRTRSPECSCAWIGHRRSDDARQAAVLSYGRRACGLALPIC
jgi:hypothetical protein